MSETSLEPVPAAADQVRRRRRKASLDPGLQAQRNLAIFKKVEIEKLTHKEVAQRFRLRRSRVTQIVKQVRMDLARASADDPLIENHFAQQRLQRSLEKFRLEYALDAAAQAMCHDKPRLVTNRAGSRHKNGHKEGWSESIMRDKPPNVQIIKTFLRVTQDLGKLNEREIANNPVGEKHSQRDLFQAIASLLAEWAASAPTRQDAPSAAFIEMVQQFEDNLRVWLYRYSMGATSVDAWPDPVLINQPAPEINLALTTSDDESTGATSDACRG